MSNRSWSDVESGRKTLERNGVAGIQPVTDEDGRKVAVSGSSGQVPGNISVPSGAKQAAGKSLNQAVRKKWFGRG
jgi:hypothetical protein